MCEGTILFRLGYPAGGARVSVGFLRGENSCSPRQSLAVPVLHRQFRDRTCTLTLQDKRGEVWVGGVYSKKR